MTTPAASVKARSSADRLPTFPMTAEHLAPSAHTAATDPRASSEGVVVLGAALTLTRPDGGSFEVTGKAAALLAMAALEGTVSRRQLSQMLWPESPDAQARTNLRTLVYRINNRYGAELLAGTGEISIECARVHIALQDADALLSGLASAGSGAFELLAHIDLAELDDLQVWLKAARQRTRMLQLTHLSQELTLALQRADAQRAIALGRACLLLEPFGERWHRQLMDTLAQCGDRAAALTAYEDCKLWLRESLGVSPDASTRALHLRILKSQAFEPPTTLSSAPVKVAPLGLSAPNGLVEREAPLAEVQAALASGIHVFLHGEAGVGKSSLLQAIAFEQVVERVTFHAGSSEEPYSAMANLLQEVQQRHALRLRVPEQIELARLAPTVFPDVRPTEGSLSTGRLRAAIVHWAEVLGSSGVRVLVLDDLHHADQESQAALSGLVSEADPQQHALLMLLSYRTGELNPVLADAAAAAQGRNRARSIGLKRLSLQGVQALLRKMNLDRNAFNPEALAPKLLQMSGGNPLFATELALSELSHPEAGFGKVGDNLEAMLRSRLAQCSSMAQQLAYVAGVALGDFTVELAAAVLGQSPLALMAGWSELQQRGLFAENGLAHDLMRDAVLAALPGAIRQATHRQIASYLEGLGLEGASVFKHWMESNEFDRALPHAQLLLRAANAAALPTLDLEVQLLGLFERASDSTLIANRWGTVEFQGKFTAGGQGAVAPPEAWTRMAALADRVERVANNQTVLTWVAFERSRVAYHRDKNPRAAYELLEAASPVANESDAIRATVELNLAFFSIGFDDRARGHVQRAKDLAAALDDTLENRLLRRSIVTMHAFVVMSPGELIVAEASRMRAARRRGDRSAEKDSRMSIASAFTMQRLSGVAHRHFSLGSDEFAGVNEAEHAPSVMMRAVVAARAGFFVTAIKLLASVPQTDANISTHYNLFSTWIWLTLGRLDLSRAHFDRQSQALAEQVLLLKPYALIRAELTRLEGKDPLPGLGQIHARMQAMGFEGLNLRLMEWEASREMLAPDLRISVGAPLLAAARDALCSPADLALLSLELAEAYALVGSDRSRALALTAAGCFRRGYTTTTGYTPDLLVRCANLLAGSDPEAATSLNYVARRWVRRALTQVPEIARNSFVTQVPVNRMLLSDEWNDEASPTVPVSGLGLN